MLSKSDFKLAQGCPTKLYYKRKGYPNANDDNAMLQYLGKGGYLVGHLAKLYYPEGREMRVQKGNFQQVLRDTEVALQAKNVTLFEAFVDARNKLAAIDILVKKGNRFQIIEVKSKGFSSSPNVAGWGEHIQDVAFQKSILQEKYPEAEIECFLFVPDKNKTASIEGLYGMFQSRPMEQEAGSRFQGHEVVFSGDRKAVIENDLMHLENIGPLVDGVIEEVKSKAELYVQSLNGQDGIVKMEGEKGAHCFGCEYRKGGEQSGFHECWGDFELPSPNIFDLYFIGNKKVGGMKWTDKMLADGEPLHFHDKLPDFLFTGKQGKRREIQLKNTLSGQEYLGNGLRAELESWQYPLHFVDFETTRTAIPVHKDVAPYQQVIFQWSIHTIEKPGAEPIHKQYLNTTPGLPNIEFAERLLAEIKTGTKLMWSSFENTAMRDIYHLIDWLKHRNPTLTEWLEETVVGAKDDYGDWVDMLKISKEHYFHPSMGKSNSIKAVFPACLHECQSLRPKQWLQNFAPGLDLWKTDEAGKPLDPYGLLPPLVIDGQEALIADGAAAMAAYPDMLYGPGKDDPEVRKAYAEALLRYCKLDTLAMVIIWEHWRTRVGL